MKISDKNEGTAYPFWIIIDPRQNFRTGIDGVYSISSMITGVWMSREAAENYLKSHIEQLNKSCKYQLEWARTVISKIKEEMKYLDK